MEHLLPKVSFGAIIQKQVGGSKKADFPGEIHQDMITFTINGKAYMGGNGISDFWKYDPSSNQWEPLNSANPAGHELSFSVGEKGYYFSEYNTIVEYVP